MRIYTEALAGICANIFYFNTLCDVRKIRESNETYIAHLVHKIGGGKNILKRSYLYLEGGSSPLRNCIRNELNLRARVVARHRSILSNRWEKRALTGR